MQRAVNISFFEQKGLNNIKTERGEKNLFTNRVVKNITYLQKIDTEKKESLHTKSLHLFKNQKPFSKEILVYSNTQVTFVP